MLYAHRPAEITWPCDPVCDHIEFFRNLSVPYQVVESSAMYDCIVQHGPDIVVVGGAGILRREIVEQFPVLNVHPGLLPASRGLDVLKWAVLECEKVGVTAHLCDEETDLGWRIMESVVPVYRHDTFHSFAMRQYEFELGMIVPSINMLKIAENRRDAFARVDRENTIARRRMKRREEAKLLPAFEEFKMVYAQ